MGELEMGVERAKNVLTLLMDKDLENVELGDIIDSVKSNGNLMRSRSYLQQECVTCYGAYPARMVSC